MNAFTINSKTLLNAVKFASKVTMKNRITKILIGKGRIQATNMDQWITVSLPEITITDVLVDPNIMMKLLRKQKGDVTIKHQQLSNNILVNEQSIRCEKSDQWPIPKQLDGNIVQGVAIKGSSIDKMLGSTSKDDTRYAICGVLIDIQDNETNYVATDGRRVVKSTEKTSLSKDNLKITIPNTTCELLSKHDWKATIDKTNLRATFTSGSVSINSCLISGHFPDYRQAIPTDSCLKSVVNRDALLNAVENCKWLWKLEKHSRVALEFVGSKCYCWCEDVAIGDFVTTVDCINRIEQPIAIAINPRFLVDCLAESDEQVVIKLNGCTEQMLIERDYNTIEVIQLLRDEKKKAIPYEPRYAIKTEQPKETNEVKQEDKVIGQPTEPCNQDDKVVDSDNIVAEQEQSEEGKAVASCPTILQYTERSIIVRGLDQQSDANKRIRELKSQTGYGVWHRKQQGWMFPSFLRDLVEKAVA